MAVKITASYHSDIGNPRPLGEEIYFFSARSKIHLIDQQLTNKMKKDIQEALKEETEYYMFDNIMNYEFG
jgi:hypothetical protein